MTKGRFLKTTLGLLISISSFGQTTDGIHRYNTNFSISKTNFVDTIPIKMMGNQIYVPVYINGERHLFNLDTGSSQGIAYTDSKIKYSNPLGDINSKDANGIIDTLQIVRLPDFELGHKGGIRISNYVGSLLKRPQRHYIYDGIIGFDLFNKGLQAKIDAKRGRLIITDIKNYFDKEPGFEVKYKLQRWTPYLEINTFLDHKESTLLDLGADDFFVMNKNSFDAERYKDPRIPEMIEETIYRQSVMGSYGVEKRALMFIINFPTIGWGNFSFRNVHGTTTQGDSKIGAQILNYGTLVINPKRKRIKFWAYTGGKSVEVSNKIEDISYMEKDGKPMVATIRHTSNLYKKGIREGDIILSIDGKPINSLEQMQEYPFADGVSYRFLIQDIRGFKKEIKSEIQ
ncbi:hypothetical protein [Prevotella sp. HUN102]|uniref:hypothetical protein n=1 Tax=Prevotella sp. HUN102 TaxID=1392486 RepID=UPI00048FD9C7|nr:hypothetical protein [Prevotella sp. HUN102]